MRKNNSRVKKRFGMNQEYSSEQNSQEFEGKSKNEGKGGNSDTNPSHEYPNSSPRFSGSRPIGKKPKVDDGYDQADVKYQWKSSEPKVSKQNDSGKINPTLPKGRKREKSSG